MSKPKSATKSNSDFDGNKGMVVIPRVKGVSEKISRIMKKDNISTVMRRPHMTIRESLVHPKDKLDVEKTVNCVDEIPCKSCAQYVGKTKRQFGPRLKEH